MTEVLTKDHAVPAVMNRGSPRSLTHPELASVHGAAGTRKTRDLLGRLVYQCVDPQRALLLQRQLDTPFAETR